MNKVKTAEHTVLLICLTQSSVLFRMSSECAHNGTGSGTPSSGWGPLPVEFPMAISYWCHQEEEIDSLLLCFQVLRSREQIAFISFSWYSTAAECSCKLSIDRVSFSEEERRWKTREKHHKRYIYFRWNILTVESCDTIFHTTFLGINSVFFSLVQNSAYNYILNVDRPIGTCLFRALCCIVTIQGLKYVCVQIILYLS